MLFKAVIEALAVLVTRRPSRCFCILHFCFGASSMKKSC